MMSDRRPRIGDLIVRKGDNDSATGVVIEIEHDKYGHDKNTFIHWFGDIPRDYQKQHGYSGLNIHNLRSVFDIYRDGNFIN